MIMNHNVYNVGFFSAIYKEIPCQGEMTNDDPFAPSEVFQDFQRESEWFFAHELWEVFFIFFPGI